MRYTIIYFVVLISTFTFAQEQEFYRYSFEYFVEKASASINTKTFLKDAEEGWILFNKNIVSIKLIDDYVDWKIIDKADSVLYGAFSEKGVWYSTSDIAYNLMMQQWKHQYYAPFWEIRMNELGFNKHYVYPGPKSNSFIGDVYDFTTEKPEFPGGMDKFYLYLSKSMNVSESSKFNDVNGKILVSFVVAKDGTIHNVNVVKSPSELITKEVELIIHNMPNWIPGRVKGKLVDSQFTLPINIMAN